MAPCGLIKKYISEEPVDSTLAIVIQMGAAGFFKALVLF
jgi:hypothetical protein